MNQMKATLGTLSVLLILIAGLGLDSRTVESTELEGDDVPGPCRNLSQKKPKVWPTLHAQSQNGQYRLIQINWDVDEVLDGDWLGVFSDDPRSISADDLKFVPQTTPIPNVTTPSDNGGLSFEVVEARPRSGDVIQTISPREGRQIDTITVMTNESKVGLNSSLSNNTLDGVQDETMHAVTEQSIQTHRKVLHRNKDIAKGKKRKVRNKIRRKSQHARRKFKNRQSLESVERIKSNSSEEQGITTYANRNAGNISVDVHNDDQSGSWKPGAPSLLTAPVEDVVSYFDEPKYHQENENKQRQHKKTQDEDLLGDNTFLVEHSSTTKILKIADYKEEKLGKEANSNEDHIISSRKLKAENGEHLFRVLREAGPQDEVIIITGKDEESRFGGGISSGIENDTPILSTSSEEEHRFGGGVGVNRGTIKDPITFVTDPNEENRFGGGLGIVSDYSLEDVDEITPSKDKEEHDEVEFTKPTAQTISETFSGVAKEGVADISQNTTMRTEEAELGSPLTTLQPRLSTDVSAPVTERDDPEDMQRNGTHSFNENVSQSFEIQSQVKGHRSKAERTGMNGDFFRGLRDSDNNDSYVSVVVNNDQATQMSSALNGAYPHFKVTQEIERKRPNKRINKLKNEKFGSTSVVSNFPTANSQSKSKVNVQKKTKSNNITLDTSIDVELTTQNTLERLHVVKLSESDVQKTTKRFTASLGNHQDQIISKQIKYEIVSLPKRSRKKLGDNQMNKEVAVKHQNTISITEKQEIGNVRSENVTSIEKTRVKNKVNIAQSDSNEKNLGKTENTRSPVNLDHVSDAPLDWKSILKTDSNRTATEIGPPTRFGKRRLRNYTGTSVHAESSLTTDTTKMTTNIGSSTRTGRQRLRYPMIRGHLSGKDSRNHDSNYGYGQRSPSHYSRDPYTEHHFRTDYEDYDNDDYHGKSKESFDYDYPHRDYDSYHSGHNFPRKSGHFSSHRGDKHHKDYDYQNDYDPYHSGHDFHGSGNKSPEIHGHHKEHHGDPYMDEYDDLYDDYPEYQKYEDDYYDEYYGTGSEPAKDVIITDGGGILRRVNTVLRDDDTSTTASPEASFGTSESPHIDDVKLGDGTFLTDLRIDSGNITKNLTNSNDFILITNGTNENEITIIASDLNAESNSVVRVVTSFSDTTNTSTIILSTNDDRDPSKVVISGLEVRPSAILITGGSHSPSIVVKNPRSVGDRLPSRIRFKRMKESNLYDLLDYSIILRWYPVQNISDFEFEVNDIAGLFRINKQFHKRVNDKMEFDFASYENRISRADKFRPLLKQNPPTKFMNENFTTKKGTYTQSGDGIIKDKKHSLIGGIAEREAYHDSSEIEADFDFNDDLRDDIDGQSKESMEEESLRTKVKYRQNSKILDYPTEDAKAPFIIEENSKIPSSQNVMILKIGSPKVLQTDSQLVKSTHSQHPLKRRSGAAPETKTAIPKEKTMQTTRLTKASILTVSSEADQVATSTHPVDYFEETTFPSYGGSVAAEPVEFSTDENSNLNDRLNSEFSKEEIKTFEQLEQEPFEVLSNRTSRTHEGDAEPGVGWSQYHPWIKFSALPTSTAGKITSTVQHPRVSSTQLSEGGCVGDWVAYIRRGEVIAAACIEAHPAWMWDNRNVLIDRPLDKLALLGAHNAGSLKATDSFDAVEAWVVCQDETILDQLLYGVRHLDIRLGYYPDTPEKLWINHAAFRWAPFSTLLDDVLRFTKLSPDLVILDIHRTPVGFEDPQATVEVLDAIQSKLGNLLYPYPSDSSSQAASSHAHDANWNLTAGATARGGNSKPRVTLGDIWTAGRSVVVCWGDRGMRLNNPWLWPSIPQEWADAQLKSDLISFLEARSQSHSRTSGFWALMAHLTPSFWDVVLRGVVGIRGFADRAAGSVDAWLEGSEWLESGNIIAVDFFHSTRMISKIIDINIARASCPHLLHERVLGGRMQSVAERVINQWKFTMKNGSIFVEKEEDEFNFFAPNLDYEAQNDTMTTQSPPVEVELVSDVEESTETIAPRKGVLQLSATDI